MKFNLIFLFTLFIITSSLKDITQNTITETTEQIEDNFNAFKKKLKKFYQKVTEQAEDTFESIKDNVKDFTKDIKKDAKTLEKTIKSSAKNLKSISQNNKKSVENGLSETNDLIITTIDDSDEQVKQTVQASQTESE